jgi:biotin operon repressor
MKPVSIDEQTLSSLVEFYRALGDETRLKLIGLLSLKPMCGLDLAEALHITPPTVSHHIGRLKSLELVRFVREDNTVYYALNAERLQALSRIRLGGLSVGGSGDGGKTSRDERQKVLSAFVVDGQVKSMPTQQKKQLYILELIAQDFEPGRDYAEREVNEIIKRRYEDYCLIRRDFIIYGYMTRERAIYRLSPRETWPDIASYGESR